MAPEPHGTLSAWEGVAFADDHHERVAAVYGQSSIVLGTEDGLSCWVRVVTGPGFADENGILAQILGSRRGALLRCSIARRLPV